MLWYIGSVYVIVLLVILIVGLGTMGIRLFGVSAEAVLSLFGKKVSSGGEGKSKPAWLNYAALAFTGIIISYFALGLSAVSDNGHSHDHSGSQGIVQTGNSGNQMAGQVNPVNTLFQDLNNQINYMDYHLKAMESRYYNGF